MTKEADDFLREFTRRGWKLSIPPQELVARLLALPGRRPRWKQTPLAPPVGRLYTDLGPYYSVSLQVTAPEVLEARGHLVACAVLLSVARYDATPRGRCPERLRALASVVLVEGHAALTYPRGP